MNITYMLFIFTYNATYNDKRELEFLIEQQISLIM